MTRLIFTALFSSIILAIGLNAAAYEKPKIRKPAQSTLKLKHCESEIDCTFSGKQVVTGTFEVFIHSYSNEDSTCTVFSEDCFDISFYPSTFKEIPYFNEYMPDRIDILNKMTALKLLTNNKIMKDIQEKKISGLRGNATVVITQYATGIACDHGYSIAHISEVKSKDRLIMKNAGEQGC
ncbi:hypothetical protein [Chitinimonas taiwanensis]|uniref:hypothetical protein n=1 Tax=Chitinimonas taiwanensis TaxID=240412 RepID=UPI000931EAEF|nr:hypothetical protein [Chitinimonas taiwanensis]